MLAGAAQPPVRFRGIEFGRRPDRRRRLGADCPPRSSVAVACVVHPEVSVTPMPSNVWFVCGLVAVVVIQWRVCCQGVVGRWAWGPGGCSVSGGWRVWVVLSAVWKLTVSWVSRARVPSAWWWASPRVSLIAWVNSG